MRNQSRAVREIAAQWGHTEEWVRVTLFRVRRKLQDEIEDLQRQLLTDHHRMQKALRATVNAERFERLRRRLEQMPIGVEKAVRKGAATADREE